MGFIRISDSGEEHRYVNVDQIERIETSANQAFAKDLAEAAGLVTVD